MALDNYASLLEGLGKNNKEKIAMGQMSYTKGGWKAEVDDYDGQTYIATEHQNIAKMCADDAHIIKANAQLIASAPLMHGQLKTGTEVLTEIQDIIVEVAKTCSPEMAEQMVIVQSYLCGVVAGNEIALAKARCK